MTLHRPSGYMLAAPGEHHICPDDQRGILEIIPLNVDERMRLRIGRYLLFKCILCGDRFLLERKA